MANEIKRSLLSPTKILWQEGAISNTEELLKPGCSQATVSQLPCCKIDGKASLLLDFGRELYGGIQFVTGMTDGAHSPIRVRLRLGESVSEAMNEPHNDHGINDDTFLLPWIGLTEYGKTGFRFARLDILEDISHLDLVEMRAISLLRPLERKGLFSCSDERLNKIWDIAVHTVHLNMQEYVWDGIKRDRLVWMGDLHPEISVISHVFGENETVTSSLDFVRERTPLPQFMNGINSYSMWWILIQHHLHLHHGNYGYLSEQKEYLLGLLQQFEQYVGEDGGETLPEHRFIDWLSADDPIAKEVGLQALLALTFKNGAELLDWLSLPEKSAHYRGLYEKMCTYCELPETKNKSVTALKLLAGLGDPEKINRDTLADEPCTRLSPFYGYYVLNARAEAGDVQGGIDLIRDFWGGMMDLGATSFWEHFDMRWLDNAGRIDEIPLENKVDVHQTYGEHCYIGYRHSLCHGWSGGPAAWMIQYILGITPATPGFKKVKISPNLGDLDWAEGSIPTPQGKIFVTVRRNGDNSLETKITLPDGIERLPETP